MKEKSYKDLLEQYERIYHQWYDDARAGKSAKSIRYVWVRKSFDRYSHNIAIALGKYIPTDCPICKSRDFIGSKREMTKKFPISIYAK